MKKTLLITCALFIFSCERTTHTETRTETERTESAGTENTSSDSPESVKKGSGTEISPQLEGVDEGASRLEVDASADTGKTNTNSNTSRQNPGTR